MTILFLPSPGTLCPQEGFVTKSTGMATSKVRLQVSVRTRRNQNPHASLVGMETVWRLWKQSGVSQKAKQRVTIRPGDSSPRYAPMTTKNSWSHKNLYTDFITALLTIAKKGTRPTCSSTDEWRKKMWPIHTAEYYPTTKMSKAPTHTTTHRNPENTTLSGRSQTPKTRDCRIPFIRNVQNRQIQNRQIRRGRKQINGC